jgi:glutaredoxin 3
MATIVIYTKENCPYCVFAKQLLDKKGAAYSEIRIDLDEAKRDEMMKLSGRRTVPQIFINDQAIGGFDDLSALEKSGELNKLLA